MFSVGFWLLLLTWSQVRPMPLSSQLSEEDEKITECIVEVLTDTLSKPEPVPLNKECMKILKEDERVLAMLRHQNLLRELEDLAHHEKPQNKHSHSEDQQLWKGDGETSSEDVFDDRLKKAEEPHKKDVMKKDDQKKDEVNKREHEDIKQVEEKEKIEENQKEEKIIKGEDDTKVIAEEAKEVLVDKDEEKKDSGMRHSRDDLEASKRRAHNDEEEHDTYKVKEIEHIDREEEERGSHRNGEVKRHYSEEDSFEDEERGHHEGFHEGHHQGHPGRHSDWKEEDEEEEEDESEEKKRNENQRSVRKRVDENASDEETAQFETEEKGMKILNSKTQIHGGHGSKYFGKNIWNDKKHHHHYEPESNEEEEEEEEEDRLKKRYRDEDSYLQKKHHTHQGEEDEQDEEEMKERNEKENEEREMEHLEEIESELKKVAEKLHKFRRG